MNQDVSRRGFLKLTSFTALSTLLLPGVFGSKKDDRSVKEQKGSILINNIEPGSMVAIWVFDSKDVYRDEFGCIVGEAVYIDVVHDLTLRVEYVYKGNAECMVRVRKVGMIPFEVSFPMDGTDIKVECARKKDWLLDEYDDE